MRATKLYDKLLRQAMQLKKRILCGKAERKECATYNDIIFRHYMRKDITREEYDTLNTLTKFY